MLGVETGEAAGVQQNDGLTLGDLALLHHVLKTCEALAGVAGVKENGFTACHVVDGVPHAGIGKVVALAHIAGFDVEILALRIKGEVEGFFDVLPVCHDVLIVLGQDGDAGEGEGRVLAAQTRVKTHVSAKAAHGADHAGITELQFLCLPRQLHGAVIVAGNADDIAAAHGDEVDLFALRFIAGSDLGEELAQLHILVAPIVLFQHDLCAHDAVKENVGGNFAGVFVQAGNDAFHAEFGGESGGETTVVGLCAAGGQQDGGALRLGIGEEIFKLTQLVAACAEGQQIVTLDVKMDAQLLGHGAQVFQRGGSAQKRNFFAAERHGCILRLFENDPPWRKACSTLYGSTNSFPRKGWRALTKGKKSCNVTYNKGDYILVFWAMRPKCFY